MNKTHLGKFKEMIPVGEMLVKFQTDMDDRQLIFSTVNTESDVEKICDKILAWGGMHGKNKSSLKSQGDKRWLEVADEIKAGKFDRATAYEEFSKLHDDGTLKGMGPAYFTKLIYFLMPDNSNAPRGYIMDQWVGCAINILNQKNVVLMDSSSSNRWSKTGQLKPSDNYQVCNVNTSENYENFCCQIEKLADEISNEPDFTELLLMSKGGQNPLEWRAYVKKNRKPRYE